LAHQYRYLDNQDFQELLNLSKNLQTFIENPQTVISDPDIDKPFIKFLIKMTSKIKDDDQILTPIETIKKVLEKMELILKNMPTKLLLIDHPSVLGLQECIYQIGECYQSINKMRQWNNEEDCIANWSDETGMGVFAVMESARYVRRALSHEIEEDIYADDFNPYYLEWLGNNIVGLIPNIEKVLSNIVNCATNIQQLDNTLRQSLSS
jgi:hypothetical protein